MASFIDLLSEHLGAALARQLAFAELLGARNWSVDVTRGKVQFGDDLTYPMQILGTEATASRTWLWAWANDASQLPPAVVVAANQLRKLGDAEGIMELSQRTFPCEVADGNTLALLASGVIGQSCYYRGPYDGGAMFFLVKGVPKSVFEPASSPRVLTVLSEAVASFNVNHRRLAESFLRSQKFTLESTTDKIVAHRADNSLLTLRFDHLDRLGNVELETVAFDKPTKRWWEIWKK